MAPKESRKRSESNRNGAASMKLKKLIPGRCDKSAKAKNRRLEREVKSLRKRMRRIESTVDSLVKAATLESTTSFRSLLSEAESSSGKRRLSLYFIYDLPPELFTSNIIYATGTRPKVPVMVGLRDENNVAVNDGHLSAIKLQVYVVEGDLEVDELEDWTGKDIEKRSVCARKVKGLLLVGSCIRTMENSVCSFDDLKFEDNSSWVPSKMFRLVVKVVENAQAPKNDKVEIRPAVSAPFRVKDQRVQPHKKHLIPSWDDEVKHLMKIGKESYGRLNAEGIRSVKDFLQRYYKDQSSLRKILGARKGVWETIIQHATKCQANGEHFRYDSKDGVELLFDCFYKLIGVSYDRKTHQTLETLLECHKCYIEQLRQQAFEDESKLVPIKNLPIGWPSGNISQWTAPQLSPQNDLLPALQDQPMQNYEALLNCPSFPQSPLLTDSFILDPQSEDPAAHSIGEIEEMEFTFPIQPRESEGFYKFL